MFRESGGHRQVPKTNIPVVGFRMDCYIIFYIHAILFVQKTTVY